MNIQNIIEALKICKCNEDDEPCKQCPIRAKEWDGAWENALGICYIQLMRQTAEVLSYTVQPTEG